MADEFKVGDVVQLKSGGPEMTITHAGPEYGTPMIYCSWFTPKGEEKGKFPPAAVKKVDGGIS